MVGGWLFRAIGLHRVLWILPALVFVGASGVALGGGLVAALLLKGADGSLRNSVHRTGSELLYLPLADGVRARAKPLIDIVGQRGGQALASLLILSENVLARGDVVLAGASAAVSLVWIAWVADLKGLYLDVFRAALREGTLRPAVDLPPVDLVSLETLFGALNSADDHEVLAAMDLLAEEGRARLIPALILYHPSQRVVLRALELFALDGRADFLPVAERLMRHADAEIRAAALRARTRVRPDEALLRAAGVGPEPARARHGGRGPRGGRLGRATRRASSLEALARRRRDLARPGAGDRRAALGGLRGRAAAASPTARRMRPWRRWRGPWARRAARASCPRCSACWAGARCGPRRGRRSLALRGGGPRLPRRGPRRRRPAGGAAAPPAAHDLPLRRHARRGRARAPRSSRSPRARCATGSCAA